MIRTLKSNRRAISLNTYFTYGTYQFLQQKLPKEQISPFPTHVLFQICSFNSNFLLHPILQTVSGKITISNLNLDAYTKKEL